MGMRGMIHKWILVLCVVFSMLLTNMQHGLNSGIEKVIQEHVFLNSLPGIETIRGEVTNTERRVVFRHVQAGFANNMMGLLSSYVIAIVENTPLMCWFWLGE